MALKSIVTLILITHVHLPFSSAVYQFMRKADAAEFSCGSAEPFRSRLARAD
jgi:hypothetical protein